MKYLLDSNSAKELDLKTQELGMPDIVLMEKAALSVANFIKNTGKRGRVVAVCGMGNNGGDGIAIARILKEWGYDVEIFLQGNYDKMSTLTELQLKIAGNCDINPSSTLNIENLTEDDILIDALFGVGFRGEINFESIFFKTIALFNKSKAYKVSVDIPSGVNATTGQVLGAAIRADTTITFGFSKVGISVYKGKDYAGEVIVSDIGFLNKAFKNINFPAFTYDKTDFPLIIPKREQYTNKGDYGKILIISGEMPGAAFLSALAAYRNGAGLVRIFTAESNRVVLQTLIPEAIITSYSDTASLSRSTKETLTDIITNWADVLAVGSGLGRSNLGYDIIKTVMTLKSDKGFSIPTIIDADGIYLFRKYLNDFNLTLDKDFLDCSNLILTPHIKELSILLNEDLNYVKNNIITLAKKFSESSFILVIKEAATVVTGAGHKLYINSTGNSAMAKAGSGDILTGIIAGLSGRKVSPSDNFTRVSTAVYLHGIGGDIASCKLGENSILAREIVSYKS